MAEFPQHRRPFLRPPFRNIPLYVAGTSMVVGYFLAPPEFRRAIESAALSRFNGGNTPPTPPSGGGGYEAGESARTGDVAMIAVVLAVLALTAFAFRPRNA